jgi:Tfp pilus assembly protein PilX
MMTTINTRMRDQRGFSMFLVIVAMFVTSMFVAAAFAAANGDLSMSGKSKDRKLAYAAAEAGLNFYQQRLDQNPDYWTLCETGPAPNGTENNPVNQPWLAGPDNRLWRNLPGGSTAQYTIELLPTPPSTRCDTSNQASILNMSTGTFRVRVTGRARSGDPLRRSIVATFRRKGFLDFLWFTDFEDRDPSAESTQTARDSRARDCANLYRPDRLPGKCREIQFITGDAMHGPMHSNDSYLYCGTPQFGDDKTHKIESSQGDPGYVSAGAGCGPAPNIQGVFKFAAPSLKMPDTNSNLKTAATATGRVYKGKTFIRFNADGTMRVTYRDPTDPTYARTISTTIAQPSNGVIYVESGGSSACIQDPPPIAEYDEADSCGNVYVSGTYTRSMTIAADSDVIIMPTTNESVIAPGGNDSNLTRPAGNDAMLGLIANNFVRVGHPCTGGTNQVTATRPLVKDPEIQAAILSLQHSFMVDNYDCGATVGKLTVRGAIVQRYRGAVGTGSGASATTGYLKGYWYDDRLRFRSPPYFLDPVRAAWGVIKTTEQVPAK